MILGSMHYI